MPRGLEGGVVFGLCPRRAVFLARGKAYLVNQSQELQHRACSEEAQLVEFPDRAYSGELPGGLYRVS